MSDLVCVKSPLPAVMCGERREGRCVVLHRSWCWNGRNGLWRRLLFRGCRAVSVGLDCVFLDGSS